MKYVDAFNLMSDLNYPNKNKKKPNNTMKTIIKF